jgi:hypothetical protein
MLLPRSLIALRDSKRSTSHNAVAFVCSSSAPLKELSFRPKLLTLDSPSPDSPSCSAASSTPEFKSKPLEPQPIFRDFIAASYQNHHLRLTPTTETESQFERNLESQCNRRCFYGASVVVEIC